MEIINKKELARRNAIDRARQKLDGEWKPDREAMPPMEGDDFYSLPIWIRQDVYYKSPELNECAIIGLDPGGTTGWSLMRFDREAFVGNKSTAQMIDLMIEWKHGQIDCGTKSGNFGTGPESSISTSGEFAGTRAIGGLLRGNPEAVVVIEGFDLAQFNKDQSLLTPVRLIAAIGYELWLGGRTYVSQSRARKAEMPDERLKQIGLYERAGGMQHARDADRHAMVYALRCANPGRKGRELRVQHWPELFVA